MKQEDKELLLKDLSSRLPYGVNVEYTSKAIVIATNTEEIITRPLFLYSINTLDDMTVSGIDDDGDSWICFFEEIKPYLLPLSSMTEEQKREEYEICKEYIIGYESDLIDFYNRNHIDYRGLIAQDLAIDATGLNIY